MNIATILKRAGYIPTKIEADELTIANEERAELLRNPGADILEQRFEKWCVRQPEAIALRELLLSHGGEQIVSPLTLHRPLLPVLVKYGRLVADDVPCTFQEMEACNCHGNVAELWREGKLTGVATGYALGLSDDEWESHTWGMYKDTIVETTVLREKYWGWTMHVPGQHKVERKLAIDMAINASLRDFPTVARGRRGDWNLTNEFWMWVSFERLVAIDAELMRNDDLERIRSQFGQRITERIEKETEFL
jgi:hypothetical protein